MRQLRVFLAGKQSIAAARATLPAVPERCAGSPFALHTAARYLTTASLPGTAPATDPVRTAVEDRYRELDPQLALVYRRCSPRPWPSLSAQSAADAVGLPRSEAPRMLAELAETGPLEETAGRQTSRTRLHRPRAAHLCASSPTGTRSQRSDRAGIRPTCFSVGNYSRPRWGLVSQPSGVTEDMASVLHAGLGRKDVLDRQQA